MLKIWLQSWLEYGINALFILSHTIFSFCKVSATLIFLPIDICSIWAARFHKYFPVVPWSSAAHKHNNTTIQFTFFLPRWNRAQRLKTWSNSNSKQDCPSKLFCNEQNNSCSQACNNTAHEKKVQNKSIMYNSVKM